MSGIDSRRGGLAPVGSTGNNTHTSAAVAAVGRSLCAEVVIEAIGATPTVTFKLQGTLDDGTTVDANANWFDLACIEPGSDTVAASFTKVAVGSFPVYLAQSHVRFVRRIRLVTSANTNVTYRCNFIEHFSN